MANRAILHLLGYNCNLYAGIGDPPLSYRTGLFTQTDASSS